MSSSALPTLLDIKVNGLPQTSVVVSVIHPFVNTYGTPYARIQVNDIRYGLSYDAQTDLWWVNPRPDSLFYEKLYGDLFYNSPIPEQFGYATLETDGNRRTQKAAKNWDDIERHLQIPNRNRLMEVGCGTGEFLIEAKLRGWKYALGNELEHTSAQVARNKGLEVFEGFFEDFDLGNNPLFDMVFADNVIEHTMQPLLFTQKACKILQTGGYLVLRLPDTQSFGPTLKLIDHTFHFSRRSIRLLLEAAGFELVEIFYSGTYKGTHYDQDPTQRIENMTVIARKHIKETRNL